METSRIFVRGLPPKFSEDDVRKHFSKFTITDVKYFPARRIGYIGYKTPEDASKAIKYFNKSFIRMSKIFAEPARAIADKELPKSRRQQKFEKSVPRNDDYVPPPKENHLKRKREEVEQDQKLKEFLDAMQPPSKQKAWANEEAQMESSSAPAAEPAEEAVAVPEGESDDEYQVLSKKPKTAQRIPSPEAESAVGTELTVHATNVAQTNEDASEELPDAPADEAGPVSDADWLRSRTNRVLDLVEDDDENPAPPTANKQEVEMREELPEAEAAQLGVALAEEAQEEDAAPSEEGKVRQTGRLFLRNLHYDVNEDDIREQFSKFGTIEEVHVPTKKIDGKGKGFAFIQFEDPEHAVEAFRENDGTIFQGRLLHIISGKAKRNDALDEFAISKLPLKKQKDVLRKKNASASTFNWNSLYLNTDAVLSTVAERLNISKAELLDPTSSDAAVKQAHAETHIIQETKGYFAKQGVDLDAFKRSSKGDLAILVKNIPHGVKADEIRQLFEEHGTIRRFLMPPAGMTAIVEFGNATQAKSAFMTLSYRKMKDSILYLEKAPKDLFKEGVSSTTIPTAVSDKPGALLSAQDLLEEEPESTNTVTLHVKNLNFSTTTQKLSETFKPLAGFRSAIVRTKTDPKRGILSLGYGFVDFSSSETASAALRAMDGYSLEGHSLKIQASHRGADAAEERRKEDAVKKAAGTKILIKNLPFEATKKDVRALFAPYGSLRSVRVPKKFDSSSRGFAFAEFSTKRDAANAMNQLRGTHLLGRHLVLTFAETEADDPELELEKMQQKVGSQANKVALQRLTSGGRKKFNVAGTDDLDEA
ncbi:Multiple RNA-binding domain-containing protein 1 [Didymosphaeria variabile]|uniref:Multiple RNA-binding domain-containing protein 1 n=1 Tax=Didymosphaeria variabile TaxID=1932322 RepID=A0A9W9CDB9_9PLEO|nr:Multiple RNA-binding domain-containing protein 1 [Didymosphaeria variabile]KAJ4357591.1 Multiple RNA-binding domain-containing protein 1 [Didymosphaeria variabile]